MLQHCIDMINQLLPEPHASLLAGMLFGVRRDMPDGFFDALVTTGTLHVIALSGMNISIIIRVLFDAVGSHLGKYFATGITIGVIVCFILFVGPSETIVRAGTMGVLSIVAVLFGRKDIPLISLILTVVTMIVINPAVITNISFQLSVGATLGIILLGKTEISTRIPELPLETDKSSIIDRITRYRISLVDFIRNDLRVTLSAQLFTVPLILFYFHRVSLVSPVANVAVGWLVAPITYLGFIMVGAGLIYQPLAQVISWIVWVPLSFFIWTVEATAAIPVASLAL